VIFGRHSFIKSTAHTSALVNGQFGQASAINAVTTFGAETRLGSAPFPGFLVTVWHSVAWPFDLCASDRSVFLVPLELAIFRPATLSMGSLYCATLSRRKKTAHPVCANEEDAHLD
jgi:hypothetical protein